MSTTPSETTILTEKDATGREHKLINTTVTGHKAISDYCTGYVSSRINAERELTTEILESAQVHINNSRQLNKDAIHNLESIGKMNRRHARINVALSIINVGIFIWYLYLINTETGMFNGIGERLGIL